MKEKIEAGKMMDNSLILTVKTSNNFKRWLGHRDNGRLKANWMPAKGFLINEVDIEINGTKRKEDLHESKYILKEVSAQENLIIAK